jgi:hypothetical protein
MSVIVTAQEARSNKHATEIAYERERTNHIQFKQLNTMMMMMMMMMMIIYNYYSKIFKNGKSIAF